MKIPGISSKSSAELAPKTEQSTTPLLPECITPALPPRTSCSARILGEERHRYTRRQRAVENVTSEQLGDNERRPKIARKRRPAQ
ncbi:hypothetical protein HPB50_000325 [Hyalomma asiaticum]|uniref:Uncharacterized protein n=1 Tax=Hyalomma asiaticum TaxID=266040 RepID=A0ACB7RUN4_HYAAI|nr:hypothetical protein HPB50_000325 [Hyalomma asiaticum]